LASNPVRVKVTWDPEGPEVGLAVSWGVTEKLVVAASEL
jgi:hypothetical protein